MFYENDTLFVDLSGNVDIASVKNKIFNVASTYKITVQPSPHWGNAPGKPSPRRNHRLPGGR